MTKELLSPRWGERQGEGGTATGSVGAPLTPTLSRRERGKQAL
jgi:hypothetical protein